MKVLVISACLINHGDDGGAVDYAQGEFADVTKDQARFLAENGRTLYTRKEEDHMKDGRFTASAAEIKAAEAEAKAKASA